ncbi:uncharacterized protein LOC113280499 [Papaver somniferum]|uniref:uncharacterized protein LOC113280499 n=1 Tax=Papaver somniferum TaxID=3469 RepID=UPI000E6FE074|nr:uncharacterized protein LOC113280499 [Papaver somniferum]
MPCNSENVILGNIVPNDEFKDNLILEPMPISMLPLEPVVTEEEFEKEIDLMMLDSDSMALETSTAHDLVSSAKMSRSDEVDVEDELGYRLGNKKDPFILVAQANQVFCVKEQGNSRWSLVISSPLKDYI